MEFAMKAVGLGIEKYFNDNWNCFDFGMMLVSLLSVILSNTFSFMKTAKSAKSTRLLRLLKINRVLRIFRTLRSFKIFNFLFAGIELFYQVNLLFKKILMCLPIGNTHTQTSKIVIDNCFPNEMFHRKYLCLTFIVVFIGNCMRMNSSDEIDSCESHAVLLVLVHRAGEFQHWHVRVQRRISVRF